MKSFIIKTYNSLSDHKDELVQIADQQLGKDYLAKATFDSFNLDPHYFAHIAFINNKVVGYTLIKICSLEELVKELFCEVAWVRRTFQNHEPIAYIKQTAVKSGMTGQGICAKLIEFRERELANKARSMIRILWKKEENTFSQLIAERYQYIFLKEIKLYWYEDSIIRKYECAICGKPPCKCSAIVSARFQVRSSC